MLSRSKRRPPLRRREKARKEGGREEEEEGGRTIKSPSSFSLSVPLSIALLAKGQKMSSPSVVAREEREREKGTRRVRLGEAEKRSVWPRVQTCSRTRHFTRSTEFPLITLFRAPGPDISLGHSLLLEGRDKKSSRSLGAWLNFKGNCPPG